MNHCRRWAVAFFAVAAAVIVVVVVAAATFILQNENAELRKYKNEREKIRERTILGNNVFFVWKEWKWMEKNGKKTEFGLKGVSFLDIVSAM